MGITIAVAAVFFFCLSIGFWFLDIQFWALASAVGSLCLCASLGIGMAMRPRRRPNGSHCKQCGYDLRATYDRCPECGLKLSRIRRAGGSVLYQGLLVGMPLPSKPCRKCGFELAGVTSRQCPQCGELLPENEDKLLATRCSKSQK